MGGKTNEEKTKEIVENISNVVLIYLYKFQIICCVVLLVSDSSEQITAAVLQENSAVPSNAGQLKTVHMLY